MSNKRKWEGFKQKVAKKRVGKSESSTLPTEYMTVQRLSSTVEGKCQKYSRIGPLTMVPLTTHPATLNSIKSDGQKHFRTSAACDVLAGERGPSYTDVNQIKNWKVVHIRYMLIFFKWAIASSFRTEEPFCFSQHSLLKFLDRGVAQINFAKLNIDLIENIICICVRFLDASHCHSVQVLDESHVQGEPSQSTMSEDLIRCTGISGVTNSKVPASVPLSQMLNIGKFIKPKKEIMTLQLEQFEIKKKNVEGPHGSQDVCSHRNLPVVDLEMHLKLTQFQEFDLENMY